MIKKRNSEMPKRYYFSIHKPDKKILKIKIQTEVTTYRHLSLPLCGLLWNKKKFTWINEHFTQTYCMTNKNGYLWVDYLEPTYYPNDIADFYCLDVVSMAKEQNILSLIKSKIDSAYYSLFYLDQFYIPGTYMYQKKHSLALILIYGYDEPRKKFLSVDFNTNTVLTIYEFSYKEFHDAYAYINSQNLIADTPLWAKMFNATFFKINNPQKKYVYKPEVFYDHLKNYIFSIGDESHLREDIKILFGKKAIYGIKVHNELCIHLNNLLENKTTMDYRFIHILAEHKTLLLKKLQFTNACHLKNKKLSTKLNEFNLIITQFDLVRRKYLKNVLRENNFTNLYGTLKNKHVISNILQSVENLKKLEYNKLQEIFEIMKNSLKGAPPAA